MSRQARVLQPVISPLCTGTEGGLTTPLFFSHGRLYAAEHRDVRERRLAMDGFMPRSTGMCESGD